MAEPVYFDFAVAVPRGVFVGGGAVQAEPLYAFKAFVAQSDVDVFPVFALCAAVQCLLLIFQVEIFYLLYDAVALKLEYLHFPAFEQAVLLFGEVPFGIVFRHDFIEHLFQVAEFAANVWLTS